MAQDLKEFLDEFEKDPRIAPLMPAAREDVRRLMEMLDEDIDLSDAPEASFENGVRGKFYRPASERK